MGKFKALKSFSGKISMIKNEVREIADEELIKDLTGAGYIVKENDGKKTKRKTGE